MNKIDESSYINPIVSEPYEIKAKRSSPIQIDPFMIGAYKDFFWSYGKSIEEHWNIIDEKINR